ncbi:MAG: cell division/cell wall cluster transcriptional repressor MraZ [Gemmatimonadota bacterium]
MSGFLGRYDFQMDEKGRVSLPAAFRKEAGGERFILLQWEKPYLTLFPEEVWKGVQERLLEYRRADPSAWTYVREITANAVEVSPDKQGRILIPAWLQAAASLQGTVVLNGVIDRVEIWDPEEYQKAIPEEAEDSRRFRYQIFR